MKSLRALLLILVCLATECLPAHEKLEAREAGFRVVHVHVERQVVLVSAAGDEVFRARFRASLHVQNSGRAAGSMELTGENGVRWRLRALTGRVELDGDGAILVVARLDLPDSRRPMPGSLVTVAVRSHADNADCLIFDILGGNVYDDMTFDVMGRIEVPTGGRPRH